MGNGNVEDRTKQSKAVNFGRTDGADLVTQAYHFLGGGSSAGSNPPQSTSISRQKTSLREWATGLGLLLKPEDLPASQIIRGGQEHDLFHHSQTDCFVKVTRNGIFGLSPGIDIILVSSGEDPRRFHLWESTPLEHLERLFIHNLIVPKINSLEGILIQPDEDFAIVTSQPRIEGVAVNQSEIDGWFQERGFRNLTLAGYYRQEDNLAIFDAQEKTSSVPAAI